MSQSTGLNSNNDTPSHGDRPVRVIFVDDHHCVGQGLVELFKKTRTIDVVAQATDGSSAVASARRHCPDVVVMDAYLPRRQDSVDATKEIVAVADSVKVLVLSSAFGADDIRALLRAGAAGYITKNCSMEEIEEAILAVADGRRYFCRTAADSLADEPGDGDMDDAFATLTSREQEIFFALAKGKDTGEIASVFHISQDTVATHRRNIFLKLNVKSVPELIWYAIDNRLINNS